jgi:hypothetical protein
MTDFGHYAKNHATKNVIEPKWAPGQPRAQYGRTLWQSAMV